jgi:hypothetical protein
VRLTVNTGLYKLAGDAQIEPATATVRMLESDWHAADGSSVSLNIEPQLKDLPEGTLQHLEIPLPTELGGRPATFTPKSATVALTLLQRDMRKSLSPVVVKFAVSPDVANRYRIELRDEGEGTTEVEVVGQLPSGVRIANEPPFIEFRLVPVTEP